MALPKGIEAYAKLYIWNAKQKICQQRQKKGGQCAYSTNACKSRYICLILRAGAILVKKKRTECVYECNILNRIKTLETHALNFCSYTYRSLLDHKYKQTRRQHSTTARPAKRFMRVVEKLNGILYIYTCSLCNTVQLPSLYTFYHQLSCYVWFPYIQSIT